MTYSLLLWRMEIMVMIKKNNNNRGNNKCSLTILHTTIYTIDTE